MSTFTSDDVSIELDAHQLLNGPACSDTEELAALIEEEQPAFQECTAAEITNPEFLDGEVEHTQLVNYCDEIEHYNKLLINH